MKLTLKEITFIDNDGEIRKYISPNFIQLLKDLIWLRNKNFQIIKIYEFK